MAHYVPILVFALVAVSFPIIALLLAKIVRAGAADPVKAEPYECGVKAPTYALDTRFSIRYYLIAVLFVVFDVETIFMFPWAVQFKALGLFGLVEMVIFSAILLLAYFYVIKKGALKGASGPGSSHRAWSRRPSTRSSTGRAGRRSGR